MAKVQSPLLGYNTNVKHKGRVFHIQTEDSGIAKPHVITHLFADGGRILKSAKTAYAEHLDKPDLAVIVKKLMQDQHKAMFLAVRDGQFDAMLATPSEAPPALSAAPPAALPDLKTAPVAEVAAPVEVRGPTTVPASPPALADDVLEAEPVLDADMLVDAELTIPLGDITAQLGDTTLRMEQGVVEAALVPEKPSRLPPPVPAAALSRRDTRTPRAPWLSESALHERTLDEVILAYLAQELEG